MLQYYLVLLFSLCYSWPATILPQILIFHVLMYCDFLSSDIVEEFSEVFISSLKCPLFTYERFLIRSHFSCRRAHLLSCYFFYYLRTPIIFVCHRISLYTSCWVIHLLLACIFLIFFFYLTSYIMCHSLVLFAASFHLIEDLIWRRTFFGMISFFDVIRDPFKVFRSE